MSACLNFASRLSRKLTSDFCSTPNCLTCELATLTVSHSRFVVPNFMLVKHVVPFTVPSPASASINALKFVLIEDNAVTRSPCNIPPDRALISPPATVVVPVSSKTFVIA